MRLVNITNSNPDLVREQLAHTDATLVELYSLGNSTVLFTDAKTHTDIIIQNKTRNLMQKEVDFAIKKLLKREPNDPELDVLKASYFIEITLHKK